MKFLLDENAEYFQSELEKQNHETMTAKKTLCRKSNL